MTNFDGFYDSNYFRTRRIWTISLSSSRGDYPCWGTNTYFCLKLLALTLTSLPLRPHIWPLPSIGMICSASLYLKAYHWLTIGIRTGTSATVTMAYHDVADRLIEICTITFWWTVILIHVHVPRLPFLFQHHAMLTRFAWFVVILKLALRWKLGWGSLTTTYFLFFSLATRWGLRSWIPRSGIKHGHRRASAREEWAVRSNMNSSIMLIMVRAVKLVTWLNLGGAYEESMPKNACGTLAVAQRLSLWWNYMMGSSHTDHYGTVHQQDYQVAMQKWQQAASHNNLDIYCEYPHQPREVRAASRGS